MLSPKELGRSSRCISLGSWLTCEDLKHLACRLLRMHVSLLEPETLMDLAVLRGLLAQVHATAGKIYLRENSDSSRRTMIVSRLRRDT